MSLQYKEQMMTEKKFQLLSNELQVETNCSRSIIESVLLKHITTRKSYKEYLIRKNKKYYIECDISGYLLPANKAFFTEVQRGVPVEGIKLSTSSILAREVRQTFINKQKEDTLKAVQEGRLEDLPSITASTADYSHLEEFAYIE